MIVNRIEVRANERVEIKKESYLSVYEVIEKITTEVVQTNRELVGDITLGRVPESALEATIMKIINKYNFQILNKDRDELVKEVLDHIFRYGLIQKILDISGCSGVFINGPENIWAKIDKRMEKMDISFGSIENLTAFIYTIKAKLRGEINENSPLAKFEDQENKLRIICCINPMAHISPTVVIRKHHEEGFNMEDLIAMGMVTRELAEDIKRCNNAGGNIIICGKGGAGKTTLMRALLEEVDKEERILVMEEQPELFLKHPNAIQLKVKRSENGKTVNIHEISEMGLMMTIDRYVYGELKSGESMAFFNGAFSGNVTITNLHAISARQAIRKAMIMMKMSGTDLSDEILLDMLHESTNIVIFLDSFVVTEVVEIVKTEKGVVYNDLWIFDIHKREATFIEGRHRKVNHIKSQAMLEKLGNKRLLREEEALAANIPINNNVVDFSRVVSTRDQHRP